MIVMWMKVQTYAAKLVLHLASKPPGHSISQAAALELAGVPEARQMNSVMAVAVKHQVLVKEVCNGRISYRLADGVLPRLNPGQTHVDVWSAADSEDADLDDPELIDWMPIKRSYVRAVDLPPPFTLAPASVFHLGGMVQQ